MTGRTLVKGNILLISLAASFGAIQSAIWLILSFLAILYHSDVIKVNSSSSENIYGDIIYMLYLGGSYKTSLTINTSNFIIFMYIYLLLSFVWLITSTFIVWVLLRGKWSRIRIALINWLILDIILAIIDLTLTSMLAADLKSAQGMTFVIVPELINYMVTDQDFCASIGIVMTLAARGYVLWILNVILGVTISFVLYNHQKSTRPSLLNRPIINGFENGSRPFSIYDQVEIDRSFENKGFEPEEKTFSPQPIMGKNPLSNSNRNSLVYGATPTYPTEGTAPYLGNERLAKIGKSAGRRSPPQPVASPIVPRLSNSPYIPPPDYTPPGSPQSRPRGVLKSLSKYEY